MAAQTAAECGLRTSIYLPDWERYGKAAGPIRNHQIIEEADVVIAFWDGKSRGTHSSIKIAIELGKPLKVFKEDK